MGEGGTNVRRMVGMTGGGGAVGMQDGRLAMRQMNSPYDR